MHDLLLRISRVFLDGTSTFDAWLNATSFQVSQVLLTLPYTFAQMGLASGLVYQLIYALMGCWSCYMTTSLYLTYRDERAKRNVTREDESVQWDEVLDGLLGCRWKWAGLFFNSAYQFLVCVIFILGCSSLAHALNDNLDTRSWTILLGGCFLTIVAIPSAQHYRIWSCMGVVATSYTAWYLTIASVSHGKEPKVKYSAPRSSEQYFMGATNLLYTFGGHAVTIEIMEAMRKPAEFKRVYLYATIYILGLTLPSAIAVYWRFGDAMLHNTYALSALPTTMFRQTALVLMLIHQFMQVGFLSLPIFLKWEKLLGVHRSSYYLKSASRVPVVLVMWFFGIMVPFKGVMDSFVGGLFTSFGVYIIPCAAHMMFHRTTTARQNAVEKPPFWMPSWIGVYCLNLTVILWVLIVGAGLGGWFGTISLFHNIHSFGLFPSCYQCHNRA